EGAVIFGSIHDLLAEQFARLSPLEQIVLCWLAIVREPVTIDEVLAVLVAPPPQGQVFEAIASLRRRSLIERGKRQASFTLQSVVLEYITTMLIAKVAHEIQQQRLDHLIAYGLEQASAKEYIRQTQQRLLVVPLLANLRKVYQARGEVEEHLHALLDLLRKRASYAQGYGPANLMALLREQCGHLRDIDLSHLSIRGAYLQGVEMQDTSLADATLRDTIFTQAFGAAWSVAISNTGTFWVAGNRRGEVHIWCEGGQTLRRSWQAHTDNTCTIAISLDERILATGGWDRAIKVWDLASGSLLWAGWHTDAVRSVAFAPDGRTLASAGTDALIHLWDVRSGAHLQTLPGQGGPIFSVVWSPDGKLLASGSADGLIRVWQVQEGQPVTCVRTIAGHTNWVRKLAFAPDGSQLASASWDGTVKLW
ncbi:MAG: WD40 repeat domain-containing protein, partial [Ktedonobacteraceae bacterium]